MISIPFSGSKKISYKRVKELVGDKYDTVLEPFGGSGVISVNLFNDGLVEKAVINDYDHFFDNYGTYLDYKDLVVKKCTELGLRKTKEDKNGYYYLDDNGNRIRVNQMTLPKNCRDILQSVIAENVPEEYWHYLARGGNFAWGVVLSHDRIHIKDFTLFAHQLETTNQRNYLKILNQTTLEHLDYRDFINKYKDEISNGNCILIIDPPYINTDQRYYEGQITEEETIELINTLNDLNCDYIFYNHNPNKIQEWFKNTDFKIEEISTINPQRKDLMIYVNKAS